MDDKGIEAFEDILERAKDLMTALLAFVEAIPQIEEKLLLTEKASAKEDGLEYTDEEIEDSVEKQIENHPIYKDLEEAIDKFTEAFE